MLLKIAVVFKLILLVILILFFHVVIPQPVVDTFFKLLLPTEYPYELNREIGRVINFYLFT